jgi:hypothetical protein
MYDDLVLVRCADAFARHVDELYLKDRIETHGGPDWTEEPVTGLFHQGG